MFNRRTFLHSGGYALALGPLLSQSACGSSPVSSRSQHRLQVADQITQDLQAWDALGMHRTGSAGGRATSDWLANEIAQAGAQPQLESLAFSRRVPGDCRVRCGQHVALGLPLFDGGSTAAAGISGAAGALNSNKPIAVAPFGVTHRHPATIALTKARKNANHRAIVAIAAADQVNPGLAVLNAEAFAHPFGPPVLQVPSNAKSWLIAAAQGAAQLHVQAELTAERTQVHNIQTRIAGRDSALAPLVIMTPCSSWWTSTAERGGGIAIWLSAIRHFVQSPPQRTVIFTANTGHELGHVGLEHFLRREQALIANAHAWIHLGANFAAKDAPVRFQASNSQWLSRGTQALQNAGIRSIDITPITQRPLGEARNIYDGGGQYLSLLGGNPWFHHPDDRWPHSIDLHKSVKLNNIMLAMAIDLANT